MDGKNASLGEMFNALKPKGIGVVDGFAATADAYGRQLSEKGLQEKLPKAFLHFDPENVSS